MCFLIIAVSSVCVLNQTLLLTWDELLPQNNHKLKILYNSDTVDLLCPTFIEI